MNGGNIQITAAKRLRQMLAEKDKTIVAPGVFDGITARLVIKNGFDCLYMTGAGTSMSRLGMADLGLASFNDMLQNAAMIASIDRSKPLIADADTGYGGPLNVAHTVRSYAQAGVAGLHIEDQVQEKRCGHLGGKLLVSREVYGNRLRAACRARDEGGGDIVIIARTDARAGRDGEGNGGFEEAIERLRLAVEIGVDVLFFEALQDEEECRRAVFNFPNVPMLLNMVPGGKTPIISNVDAKYLGFKIVIWPVVGVEAMVPAVDKALETLRVTERPPPDQAAGPAKLFEVCGLGDLMAFDQSVGGKAYDNV